MNKNKIALILGTMCLVLTAAIIIQINTIKSASKTIGTTLKDNSGLKDELLRAQEEYNNLHETLEKTEQKLEQTRQNATKNDENDIAQEEEIKKNQTLLGLTEVEGPGLIIKLDDNREVESDEVLNISEYLVHDADLLFIINELFNAGADAVAINGQRIVPTTSILCDGNIIRVNGKMIGVPINIEAIGYPERMYGALVRPGSYLEYMANDGVQVYVEKTNYLKLPKFEGVYSYEHLTRGDI